MDKKELIDLVRQTRGIILDREQAQHITVKGAADYVTEVDKRVQAFLGQELRKRTPQAVLIAEEQENAQPDPEGTYWILDPVDGTTNLIHDYQMSAVSLAYYEKGMVRCGVVYNPFTEDLFWAEAGGGAWHNGERMKVSQAVCLKDSLISYGSSPYRKEELAAKIFPVFFNIFCQVADFRRTGSAALDLCYVAMGRQDAYFEADLKPWDFAAGQLMVKEAGGICTTLAGEELQVLARSGVLAAAPGIYGQIRKEVESLAGCLL